MWYTAINASFGIKHFDYTATLPVFSSVTLNMSTALLDPHKSDQQNKSISMVCFMEYIRTYYTGSHEFKFLFSFPFYY